jgi:hypothetical protein
VARDSKVFDGRETENLRRAETREEEQETKPTGYAVGKISATEMDVVLAVRALVACFRIRVGR